MQREYQIFRSSRSLQSSNRTAWLALMLATLFLALSCSPQRVYNRSDFLKPINQRRLIVHYTPMADSFFVGEPALVKRSIVNLGGKIEYWFIEEVSSLEVFDSNGQLLQPHFQYVASYVCGIFIPGIGDNCTHAIHPGQAEDLILDASGNYGRYQLGVGSYLPEGRYIVTSSGVPADSAWITVVTPKDSAELAALSLFLVLFSDYSMETDWQRLVHNCTKIVEDYPRSKLVARSLSGLLDATRFQPLLVSPELSHFAATRMLTEYSEHQYASVAANYVDPKRLSDSEKPQVRSALKALIAKEAPEQSDTRSQLKKILKSIK